MSYESFIDLTEFRVVRRYLNSKSPMRGILFVASREMLSEVASALDQSTGKGLRQQIMERWFATGLLRPASTGDPRHRQGSGVSLEKIADDVRCEVIYLPPVYLVHIPESGLFGRVRIGQE